MTRTARSPRPRPWPRSRGTGGPRPCWSRSHSRWWPRRSAAPAHRAPAPRRTASSSRARPRGVARFPARSNRPTGLLRQVLGQRLPVVRVPALGDVLHLVVRDAVLGEGELGLVAVLLHGEGSHAEHTLRPVL